MKIQIHQMLHGYNQGHNLIQSSIVLPSSGLHGNIKRLVRVCQSAR